MNKGMMMMLKALGLEIAPEHLAMLQALIPQLPAKINEVVQGINAALANFDARLRALELEAKAYRIELSNELAAIREVLNGNPARISDAPGPAEPASRRSRKPASGGTTGNGGSN